MSNPDSKVSGLKISVGGNVDEQNKSFKSLCSAFLTAVLLIYLVLATKFRSYLQPLIVMLTIPFSFIGVIAGLILTGTSFSVISFISIAGLSGIVVNDSLILVEFINKEKKKGNNKTDSLVIAGKNRLRPIFLTTITTILGLIPMLISTSDAVYMWKPMAICISFGLSFGTVLTLLVIPVVYSVSGGTGKTGYSFISRK